MKKLTKYLAALCAFTCLNFNVSNCQPDNVTLRTKSNLLNCDSILEFTKGVAKGLGNTSGLSHDSPPLEKRYIFITDMPCKLVGFSHSMLHTTMRLNYFGFSNALACQGMHHQSKVRRRIPVTSLMAHFLINVLQKRRWGSLVVFVDQEDEYQSSTLINALTDSNFNALILKVQNPTSKLTQFEKIIPPLVNQYSSLIILSRHHAAIFAEAKKMNLFVDPFHWMIATYNPDGVLESLKNLSLQYVNDVTIAVPVVREMNRVARSYYAEQVNLNKPLLFTCKTTTRSHFGDTKHHLQNVTAMFYNLFHYSMLCEGRDFDLQSKGYYNISLTPRKDPLQMRWPPHTVNRNLSGCVFRVAIAHNPPYVIITKHSNRNFTVSGFDYDVFIELTKVLHFRYKFYMVNDGEYGHYQANTRRWTGLVGELAIGRAHMALPSLTLTEDRFKVVDFSTSMSTSRTRIFIHPPHQSVHMGRYYAPFHLNLWYAIVANLLVFTVAYAVAHACLSSKTPTVVDSETVRRLARGDRSVTRRWWRRTATDLWDTFYTFLCAGLQQGSERPPNRLSERMVFATFVVLVVLLHSVYSSVLVSYMSVRWPEMPFRTIDDLANHKDLIPCILRGSSHEEIIKARYRKVYLRILANGEQGLMSSYEEAIESMHTKKCAFISNTVNVEYILQRNCSFAWSREVYRFSQHLAFQQGFPHQAIFSIYIMKLQSVGILSRLSRKHMHPMFAHCFEQSAGHRSLTLGHLKTMFVVLLGGISVTICVLVLEKVVYWFLTPRVVGKKVPKKSIFAVAYTPQ